MSSIIRSWKALSRLDKAVAVLTAIALGMTLYYMGALVIAEQIFNGVCAIFWAMGRAMLNGLMLYEDILETKPPLIFAMSAISMQLFGNQAVGYIYHTILLFAVPAVAAWYAVRRLNRHHATSIALVIFSLLLGTLMVRYLSRHPTAWAIEFFGLATSCLFLLVFAESEEVSWKRSALLTLLLALSVGMKESFILVILSGVVFLARSKQQWIRGFILPTVFTAIIGVVALLAFGALKAYFSVYLPQMLGYYVQRFTIPFLLRGLVFDKVLENVGQFSLLFAVLTLAAFFMPMLVGRTQGEKSTVWIWFCRFMMLCAISTYSSTSFMFQTSQGFLVLVIGFLLYRWRKSSTRLVDAFLMIAALLMLGIRYVCVILRWVSEVATGTPVSASACVAPSTILVVFTAMAIGVVCATILTLRLTTEKEERPLLLSIAQLEVVFFIFYGVILFKIQLPTMWTAIVFPLLSAWIVWTWYQKRGTPEGSTLCELLLRFVGFFIVAQSISMGSDFQGHHFLSIVPFLLALFLPVIDILAHRAAQERLVALWLGALSLVIIVNPLRHPALDNLPSAIAASNRQVMAYQRQGQSIDAIATSCNYDRYLVLGAGDVYGFTTHSPSNYFLWSGIQALNQHPVIQDRTLISIADAKVIFIGDQLPTKEQMSPAEQGAMTYIVENFVQDVPDCAKGIDPPKNLLVLYRKAK
jgi:hypothetical protein